MATFRHNKATHGPQGNIYLISNFDQNINVHWIINIKRKEKKAQQSLPSWMDLMESEIDSSETWRSFH